MHGAAARAGAVGDIGVEAVEHRRELGLDVGQLEAFLVDAVLAGRTEPAQRVELAGAALALDHQPDGAGLALRRVRDARRQQENLAGADRDVADHGAAVGLLGDAQRHLAFELVEELGAVLDVEVGARVRGGSRCASSGRRPPCR